MFTFLRNAMIALAAVTLLGISSPAEAAKKKYDREHYAKRIANAEKYLREFQEKSDYRVPRDIMKEAHGIVIMRQIKGAFVFGIRAGDGISMVRDENGQWSAPSFVKTWQMSVGFQAGAAHIESILVIVNEKGLKALTRSKFKLGAGGGIAVGPAGRDANIGVGAGVAILSYSKSKGAFAGISLEGGYLGKDDKANRIFYGQEDISADDILFNNAVAMPSEARELVRLLDQYMMDAEEAEKEQGAREKARAERKAQEEAAERAKVLEMQIRAAEEDVREAREHLQSKEQELQEAQSMTNR